MAEVNGESSETWCEIVYCWGSGELPTYSEGGGADQALREEGLARL